MPRLFIGVPATAPLDTGDVTAALEDAGRVKLVDPSVYHVTIAFLGDTPQDRVDEAADALREGAAHVTRTPGEVHGLGAFPRPDRARVVWAAVRDAPLDALARGVRRALRDRRFDFDNKAFHAHLTLARAKRPLDIARLVHEHADRRFGSFPAEHACLYASTLTPEGPRYDALTTVALEADA